MPVSGRSWLWVLIVAAACGDRAPVAPVVTFPERSPPPKGPEVLCESSLQCGGGKVCLAGICALAPEPDAGVIEDAGFEDATPIVEDAEVAEADATITDSGFDAGVSLDATPTDRTTGPSYDLSGCVLVNLEVPTSQRFEIPAGTMLRPGEVLILVRSATRAELEAELGPLPTTTQVISTGATSVGAPIINGNESFALEAPDGRMLDETTTVGRAGFDYQRDATGAFVEGPEDAATPGIAPAGLSSPTPMITEWTDRSGTGQFRFELVEISYQP
jgi:hypothetical protein